MPGLNFVFGCEVFAVVVVIGWVIYCLVLKISGRGLPGMLVHEGIYLRVIPSSDKGLIGLSEEGADCIVLFADRDIPIKGNVKINYPSRTLIRITINADGKYHTEKVN